MDEDKKIFSRTGSTLAGVRLIIPDHVVGASRVAYAFLVYMLSPLPRRSGWAYYFAQSPSRISLPRKGHRVGLRIVLFEMLWGAAARKMHPSSLM
jgi:hypothetical protein